MAKLNPSGAGPEAKVVAQGNTNIFVVLVMWAITAYFFKGHLPTTLEIALPGLLGWLFGLAAGWLAHHTPRLDEVIRLVSESQQRLIAAAAAAQMQQQTVPTARPQPPAQPMPRIEEAPPSGT